MNKVIASAALTASMVGGGFVGAALLGGSALAQDDSSDEDTDPSGAPERGPCGERIEELAAVLNTDVDTLRDALRNGQTLAEVAEANGVEVQAVVDAIVAQMQERIDAALADDRITAEEAPERGPCGERIEELAAVLNTDVDTLRDALRDGQTLAEVAEANGVEVQAVIDAIVAQMQERIDAALADDRITAEEAAEKSADLEQRATEIVNGEAPLGRHHRGPGFGHGPRGERLEELATTLGTDVDSLREALRNGQSIADVAEANGADVQDVIDAMIAHAEERLDQAVADGKLTAEEAADKQAEIAERVDDVVNGEAPFGPGGRRGPGGPRGPVDRDGSDGDVNGGVEGSLFAETQPA